MNYPPKPVGRSTIKLVIGGGHVTNDEAKKEIDKIFDDIIKKGDIIIKQAKQEGRWLPGLDSNRHLFDEIDAERDRRILEVIAQIDE